MEDLNALLPIPSWKPVYGRRETLHGTSKHDKRLSPANTCIAHANANLFHLSIYCSLHICLSFNFDLLTLNVLNQLRIILFCKIKHQPRPRNFSRNCKILVSRQPKKYPSKILNKNNFKELNWEEKKGESWGAKIKKGYKLPVIVQMSPWFWQNIEMNIFFKLQIQSMNFF
jgi:hypothetical protein